MISLSSLRLLYTTFCVALGLIILTPTITSVISFSEGEKFSEFYILGSTNMANDYPFSVETKAIYYISLAIANHMNDLKYYKVYVKLGNQTDRLPNGMNGTPSTLEAIFEYNVFLDAGKIWERRIAFSFEEIRSSGNSCRVTEIMIDDHTLNVDKASILDQTSNNFRYQLFFELWLYNTATSDFLYQNQFTSIWLAMKTGL